MYETALNILNKLYNLGYEGYIVGGYARDKYLNIKSSDIDICTDAKPNEIKGIFKIIKDNSNFGSVIIKEDNYEFEITTFRHDYYKDSRYPKIMYVDSLLEDLERRDFKINTLCIDKDGNFIDLLNSKTDFENKIINSVGDPYNKFLEDPIRILRAIRFSLKLNFNLSKDIIEAIDGCKDSLNKLNKNIVEKEVKQILSYDKGKDFLDKFNLNSYIHYN